MVTMTVEDLLADGWDWREVFAAAGEPGCYGGNPVNISAVLNDAASLAEFTRADVARVIAAVEGENDGASWEIVVELKDGRFAFLEGGCDFTGWDCQSSCSCVVASNLPDLVQYGLTDEARDRLGLGAA